jgi:hypothetical protein
LVVSVVLGTDVAADNCFVVSAMPALVGADVKPFPTVPELCSARSFAGMAFDTVGGGEGGTWDPGCP